MSVKGVIGFVGNGVPPPGPSGEEEEQELKAFKKRRIYKLIFIFINLSDYTKKTPGYFQSRWIKIYLLSFSNLYKATASLSVNADHKF